MVRITSFSFFETKFLIAAYKTPAENMAIVQPVKISI